MKQLHTLNYRKISSQGNCIQVSIYSFLHKQGLSWKESLKKNNVNTNKLLELFTWRAKLTSVTWQQHWIARVGGVSGRSQWPLGHHKGQDQFYFVFSQTASKNKQRGNFSFGLLVCHSGKQVFPNIHLYIWSLYRAFVLNDGSSPQCHVVYRSVSASL